MKRNIANVIVFIILSILIYLFSVYNLGQQIDAVFILILAIPCLLYFWFYKGRADAYEPTMEKQIAKILTAYTVIYIVSIYFFNLLGSSIALWLVQFTIPLLILKIYKQPLQAINFQWKYVFKDFKFVLLSAAILTPFLLYGVRDSEQIIELFKNGKGFVYLPLSIIYMLLIVAFWEDFFFRGIVQSSIQKKTKNSVATIFLSSFLFGIYHLPMRYLNPKSTYYGDLVHSFSATISEQFLMGLFLGIIVYKSKNVWHGIWLHSFFNGFSFVYQLSLMLKI
jgi:membrane protease YdiL (CAAX protease family)